MKCKNLVKTSIIWSSFLVLILPYSGLGITAMAQAPGIGPFKLTEVQSWKLYLYNKLNEQGFEYLDFYKLRKIADCESGWRQYGKEGDILRGRVHPPDVGIFQINTSVHKVDVSTPEANIDYAIELYGKNGLKDWVCTV